MTTTQSPSISAKPEFSELSLSACVLFPLLLGLVSLPILDIAAHIMFKYLPLKDAVAAVSSQLFGEPGGWFIHFRVQTTPFVVLAIALLLNIRSTSIKGLWVMCMAGVLGTCVLLIPLDLAVLKHLYTAEKQGSTGALAMIVIPYYSVIPMAICFLVARLLTRKMSLAQIPDSRTIRLNNLPVFACVFAVASICGVCLELPLWLAGLVLSIAACIEAAKKRSNHQGMYLAVGAMIITIVNGSALTIEWIQGRFIAGLGDWPW